MYIHYRKGEEQKKQHQKTPNRIATSAATSTIILKPNGIMGIIDYCDKEIDHIPTTAIKHETDASSFPSDIDITPALVN